MKTKRLFTAIVSVLAAASLGLTALSGCADKDKCLDGGEHTYVWEVDKEPTCKTEGKRTGVCPVCGDIKEEVLPVDPDAHQYGDWQITQSPTQTATGTAVKTCALDATHTVSVTLPVYNIDGSKGEYDQCDVVKQVTAAEDGELKLVLNNELGNIEFNVTVPQKPVECLEDAVVLASSLGSHIRTSEGYYTEAEEFASGGTGPVVAGGTYNFNVYFGDDYVRVRDTGENKESWYSKDAEGNAFGIATDAIISVDKSEDEWKWNVTVTSDATRDESATEGNLNGFSYQSGGGDKRVYGAEELLRNAYLKYTMAKFKDTSKEQYLKTDNGYIISFAFSEYENPKYVRYEISANLYPTGEIKTITQHTNIIHEYMIASNDNGDKLFAENGDVIFAPGYSDASEEINRRTIVYTNQVLKTADDVVPENQYPGTSLFITDFDLVYTENSQTVGDQPFDVPSNTKLDFRIKNIQPTTGTLEYDPLVPYIRETLEDGTTRDIALTEDYYDNEYRCMGFFNYDTSQVTLRAQYAGNLTVVLKTKGGLCEKVVTFNFTKSSPSTSGDNYFPLLVEHNKYTEAGNKVLYTWTSCSTSSPVEVYANQPFTIRTTTTAEGIPFIDTDFNITNGIDKIEGDLNDYDSYVPVADGVVSYNMDASNMATFTIKEAGTYLITLTSVKNTRVSTEFLVEVAEQPSIPEMFKNGTVYEGEFSTIKESEGGVSRTAEVKLTVENNNSFANGRLKIEVLGNTTWYNYTLTREGDIYKLTATYAEGVSPENNSTFDFVFSLNEAFRISVTHSTGYSDIKESIILTPPEPEEA